MKKLKESLFTRKDEAPQMCVELMRKVNELIDELEQLKEEKKEAIINNVSIEGNISHEELEIVVKEKLKGKGKGKVE